VTADGLYVERTETWSRRTLVVDLVQVLQSAVVLDCARLYARADSIVQPKRGMSVLQPYSDLAKLLRKAACYCVVSDRSGETQDTAIAELADFAGRPAAVVT
jgi:enolase